MKVLGLKGKLFTGKRRTMELVAMLGPESGIQPLEDEPNDGMAGSDASGIDGGSGGDREPIARRELSASPATPKSTEELEPAPSETEPPPPPAKKREEKTPTKAEVIRPPLSQRRRS